MIRMISKFELCIKLCIKKGESLLKNSDGLVLDWPVKHGIF